MGETFRQVWRFASAEETARCAATLAPALKPGDVILLQGGLGTGKTHFARALIQARLAASGQAEDVPSPTYTLVQTYSDGAVELWHADLYRLSGVEELSELGLEDALETAICLIEWPDRLGDLTPPGAVTLTFAMTDIPGERVVTATSDDRRWAGLLSGSAGGGACG